MKNHISILLTGDTCPQYRVRDLVANDQISEVYNEFLPELRKNDLNITNLECPITNTLSPIVKKGPNLYTNEKSVEMLNYGNIHLATLSNNHIMDHGSNGLNSTLQILKKNSIDSVGAGQNLEEASNIWYKSIKGKLIAVLNFSEIEFSTAGNNLPGSNPLNPVRNYYSIQEANRKADYIIVIVHGGHEGYQLPSPRMINTYRFFIDSGASIVVGHHTHCFSGYEEYKGKRIFYSLGNFIFDSKSNRNSSWNYGYAVRINIDDKNESFDILPYVQCGAKPGLRKLDQNEQVHFFNELKDLNETIIDERKLMDNWNEYVEVKRNEYLLRYECFDFWIYKVLRYKKLFPSLLSKKKKLQLLNSLRCQSHRDLSIDCLR